MRAATTETEEHAAVIASEKNAERRAYYSTAVRDRCTPINFKRILLTFSVFDVRRLTKIAGKIGARHRRKVVLRLRATAPHLVKPSSLCRLTQSPRQRRAVSSSPN